MDVGRPVGGQQFRNKDGDDKRMYNPHRDIAWITPQLMQLTTLSFFKEGEAQTDFCRAVDDMRIRAGDHTAREAGDYETYFDKLTELCLAIGHDFCEKFMRGERTFTKAFEDAGLYERFPGWMVDMWIKHFGHTVMSAFYYGIRDVTFKDRDDPMNYDEIFKTAEEVRWGINNAT